MLQVCLFKNFCGESVFIANEVWGFRVCQVAGTTHHKVVPVGDIFLIIFCVVLIFIRQRRSFTLFLPPLSTPFGIPHTRPYDTSTSWIVFSCWARSISSTLFMMVIMAITTKLAHSSSCLCPNAWDVNSATKNKIIVNFFMPLYVI